MKPDKKTIIFICKSIKNVANSTRYQRCVALSQLYNLILICKTPPPQTIHQLCYRVIHIKSFYILKSLIKISYLKEKLSIFAVHTQYSIDSSIIGYASQSIWGMRWIYDLWDHPSLEYQLAKEPLKYYKYLSWILIGKRIIKKASLWIVGMHPSISQHLPFNSNNIPTIYLKNGITKKSYYFLSRTDDKIPLSSKNGSELIVGCAGWILLKRGIKEIIRAMSHESLAQTKIKVYLLGNSDERTVRAINEYNENNKHKISYLGNCSHDEALQIIKSCHVLLCFLSQTVINYRYAYPIKLFEYMATGKIIIATKTNATKEIIHNGFNGFLIDNDPNQIVKILYDIYQNSLSTTNIGTNARLTAQNYYWEDINTYLINQLKTININW